jgi:FixJ family two-component response regulator
MVSARIAVVEDHEGLRRALVRLLQASGHEVSCFASAEDLLACEDRVRAQCLVLDVRLPGLSGFELRARLGSEGLDTPVIYVTAHDDPAARRRASQEGAPFLLKPVDGRTLLAAIGTVLRTECG